MSEFVSASCGGERCYCGHPAQRKVEETIFHDDPHQIRHPLTAYLCMKHFGLVMGPAAAQSPAPEPSATAQRARELLDHIEKPVAGMPPAFHDFTFLMAVRDFLRALAGERP